MKPRAAVEAIASTAADAASVMLQRPSTRNLALVLLSMDYRHPLGSADGSKPCRGMQLWSTRGELYIQSFAKSDCEFKR